MAGAKETAIGIASVLGSEHSPDPFLLTFRGQVLEEAAEIIQFVLAECRDAGIMLSRIDLDPELFDELEDKLDVPTRLSLDLEAGARFVRGD